jgi:hypothetical protein
MVCQEHAYGYLNFKLKPMEGFQSSKGSLIPQEIARQLQIDPSRIKDFQELGTPGNLAEYQIKMQIWPRNIMNQADPLINDIAKMLQQKQLDKKSFKITNTDGQEVFLSEINVNTKDIINTETESQHLAQFTNPAIAAQIQYLTDKQTGIPSDPSLDRAPKWHKGQIIIPPEEEYATITPTPRPTHPLTDQATIPTISVIQ